MGLVSGRDQTLHDLSDRLNGIMISVELVLRLLEGQDAKEVSQVLARVRDDCVLCTQLLGELREQTPD
jgi:hypothetical protein